MGYQMDVYIYNLPPIKTCKPTEWCLKGRNGNPVCYALRNNHLFKTVQKGIKERYELSKKQCFVPLMVYEIQKKKVKFFRFHSSGDFYSEGYVRKVIDIVRQCPNTLFRTSTRRRDLTSVIQELNSLPNMIVRESLDSAVPDPVMSLPFAAFDTLDIVRTQESYKCLNHCPSCDYYCWKHPVNINFSMH